MSSAAVTTGNIPNVILYLVALHYVIVLYAVINPFKTIKPETHSEYPDEIFIMRRYIRFCTVLDKIDFQKKKYNMFLLKR